jgi:serine/threonine-protein kinase
VLLANRYELLRRVGHGGMGQVWEAQDTLLGRHVAVKTVLLEDATDAEISSRVLREASATAQLSHPDIVTVHDAGTDPDAPGGPTAFIVMELLEGKNLRDLLAERGPFPLGEALRIGADVASALAASHEIGVVHRDIKPANVLVDDGRVTVVDFGIAALTRSSDPTIAEPGSTLGTAAYMAPEQAAGRQVSPASDVYSLGCVLFTLLTGEPPFSGEHFLAVLQQHAFEDPPLLTDRRDVPAEITEFLDRMLAKDPAARPSACEVASSLAHLAAVHDPDDDATRASAPSPGETPAVVAGLPALPESTRELPALPGGDDIPVLPGGAASPEDTAPGADTALPVNAASPEGVPTPALTSQTRPTAATPDASLTGSQPAWHRRPGNGNWILLAVAIIAIVAVLTIVYSLGMRQGVEIADPETPEPTALSLVRHHS